MATMTSTSDAESRLTIDQLAQRTGMTVRNIRAHQSRGLLPPPVVEARTGYYDDEHLARIKLIQEMQAEGFNLKAIERLIEGSSGAVEEALGFKRAVLTPFGDEEPEYITQEELDQRLKGPYDAKVARKAVKLGLIKPIGDDRSEVPSPPLLAARHRPTERDHIGDRVAGGVRAEVEEVVDQVRDREQQPDDCRHRAEAALTAHGRDDEQHAEPEEQRTDIAH